MRSRRNEQVSKRVYAALGVFTFLIIGTVLVTSGKYLPPLFQLFFQREINLKSGTQNHVNILLLGTGGGMHDGPNLTDTMIFASIDPSNKKVTLVSIPRDLWVPQLKHKINFAYADGEAKKKGGGIIEARAAVKSVLGQNIDYTLRLDFDGFVKAIDMVGGLDVTVDNALDDSQYPLGGKENESCGHSDIEIASLSAQLATGSATELDAFPCRYEHLRFDKGVHKMDGITALKFVRSRHAEGQEGSDFARSKRQEKVISAFKEKVFSLNTFLNPVKLVSLAGVFKDSIDTDIKEEEYDDFVKLAQKLRGAKIKSAVLDSGDDQANRLGLITQGVDGNYDGQYVLVPNQGDGKFSEIQEYINCEIKIGDCIVTKNGIATPIPTPTVKSDAIKH